MNWFETLAPRERLLIGIAAVLLGLFILSQFLIRPVLSATNEAARDLTAAKRNHVIVSNGLPKISLQDGNSNKVAFDRNGIVDVARLTNVGISRVQPAADGSSLQVWLNDSPALNVYSFLSQLDSRYSMSTEKAQITRREGGVVSAQFTFAAQ